MRFLRAFVLLLVAAALVALGTPASVRCAETSGEEDTEVEAEDSSQTETEETEESTEEQDQAEETQQLGEIKVTARIFSGRLLPEPMPVESLSMEDFELAAAEDLSALDRASSVTVQEYFGGNAISLLGLNPKFTQILVDGQRVSGFIDQKIDAAQIPLAGIERIEVIRGPLSPLYGSGAVGGVVNLITRRPQEKLEGAWRLRGGSHGFNSESLEVCKASSGGEFFLSFRRGQRNTIDLNKRTPETDGDAYNSSHLLGRGSLNLSPHLAFAFQGSYFDEFSHNTQSAFGGLPQRNDFDTRRVDTTSTLTYHPRANLSCSLCHHESSYDHHVSTYFETLTPNRLREDSFNERFSDTELTLKSYTASDLWQSGLIHSRDDITSERVFDGRASTHTDSLYANWEHFLSDRSSVSLGLRADDHSSFGLNFSPKFSFWQQLSPAAQLRIGYGHGFRAPSLKELYFSYNSPYGYTVRGDPNLAPEIADGVTATLSYAPSRDSLWEFTLFRNEVKDLITASRVSSAPMVFKEVNVGRARTQGLSIYHQRRLLDDLTVSCDNTIAMAEDVDTGNLLPQSPRTRSVLSLKARFNRWGEVELANTLRSPYYTSVENTRLAPGFYTLDVNWRLPTEWGDLILNAKNLFDRVNRRYGPKPGREFFLSLNRKF